METCSINKNLEELLLGVSNFDLIRESAESFSMEDLKNLCYQNIEKGFHQEDMQILIQLNKLGKSNEDLIEVMREHIVECEKCGEKYKTYLDEQAERYVRINEGMKKVGARNGNQSSKEKYLEGIKNSDILGLYS